MLSASSGISGGIVVDLEYVLQRLPAIADELKAIRDRICDPKSNDNPRYHGLSLAVGKTHARRWHDSGRRAEARNFEPGAEITAWRCQLHAA
jgi:hypothetical protein